ncbi:hypothetical protein SAMN02745166_03116 [Prosthecobacter debontii]|uniref:Uncharacterized protein n=1 Tax=Prosthecobacter debontii TaxID=48467 RepID=A0A1T4YF25_9BACT|nr:hypothetical protein SAMN02745166_03116 [Prosthecobacter debontii]
MDWISTLIGLSLLAVIVSATVLMMRHREQTRLAAREAEALNITSNDTRRSFWYASVDASDTPHPSSDGMDGDGD